MPLDPRTEIELTNSLSDARDSIKLIETTTKRIHNIINDVADDGDRRRPLRGHNERDYDVHFGPRFVTAIVTLLVAMMGFFGVLFFQYTKTTTIELDVVTAKILKLESRVRDVESTQASRSGVK